jgi:hypothetical protein
MTFVVNLGFVMSWLYAPYMAGPIAQPFIFDMVAPCMWITGTICTGNAILILTMRSSKARAYLCDLWIFTTCIHFVMILVYGIHMIFQFNELGEMHGEIFDALSDSVGAVMPKTKTGRLADTLAPKGGALARTLKHVRAAAIIKYSHYPMDVFFLLGERSDITALFFVILPGVSQLMTLPFVISIRNFFRSSKIQIMKARGDYHNVPLTSFTFSRPDLGSSRWENEDYDDENISIIPSTFADDSEEHSGDDYPSEYEDSDSEYQSSNY